MPADRSRQRVALLCYDGSVAAGDALEAAGALLAGWRGIVATAWLPGQDDPALRRRVWARRGTAAALNAAHDAERDAAAGRIAARGAAIASAAGIASTARSLRGDVLPTDVARLADEVGADVVVVGAHGQGAASAALGSVADAIVHAGGPPVLVVRHPLLAVEWSRLAAGPVVVGCVAGPAGAAAVDAGLELAGVRRPLVVVHVGEGADATAAVRDAAVRARDAGAAVVEQVRAPAEGRAWAALLAVADEVGGAAVVVSHRPAEGVRAALHGSTALGAAHHATVPVLVARAPV